VRKIIQSINITPDGFCDHTAVIADEALHSYANELIKNADTALFGRVTFQLFEGYWPQVAKNRTEPPSIVEFADLVENINKVVFSRTLEKVDWKNSTISREINRDAILKLKQEAGKDIVLMGSPRIVSEFARLNVIDEYHFVVHPIIAGKGKKLFEKSDLIQSLNLRLAGTRTFDSGAVALSYQAQT
jgi:dihydrofolate reductase